MSRFKKKAKIFTPHAFKNKVEFGPTPKILMTPEVFRDMYALVNLVETEVGWLGSVKKIGNDYLIDEIFLLDQEVHSTTTEITPDGVADFTMHILDTREDGVDLVNRIRFWGHSHVNMGTSPSAQDENQMKILSESCDDFFIRGIFNKKGRIEFTLFLYSADMVIRDVAWAIYYEPEDTKDIEEKWQKEIATKVKEKGYFGWANKFLHSNEKSSIGFQPNGDEKEVAVTGSEEPEDDKEAQEILHKHQKHAYNKKHNRKNRKL